MQTAQSKHNYRVIDDFFPKIFYVYTDIIEHQYIGDTFKKLLKVVPVRNNDDSDFISFTNPHYVPVEQMQFDFIHISIKDDSNNLIKFEDGFNKVILKLHFRPRKINFR